MALRTDVAPSGGLEFAEAVDPVAQGLAIQREL
jgi:hypothetical protein